MRFLVFTWPFQDHGLLKIAQEKQAVLTVPTQLLLYLVDSLFVVTSGNKMVTKHASFIFTKQDLKGKTDAAQKTIKPHNYSLF